MTLFEIIDRNARLGKHSIVQTNRGYIIVSPFKDREDHWRDSGTWSKQSQPEFSIGCITGCSADRWNEAESEGAKYIGIYEPPIHERFKVDDKVIVRADAKERCEARGLAWYEYKGELVNKPAVVQDINGSDYLVNGYRFPHDALDPYYPTEPETITINGKTYDADKVKERLASLEEVE